jgi:3-hydroxyisobutyrate dehydrogenase-like beta-hydroxyacid dehydrogenase
MPSSFGVGSVTPVVAVVGTGDMGSAVGAMFRRQAYRVVTDLTGRSALSRELAERARLEDLGSLEAVVAAADILLAILPPAAAFDFAARAAAAVRSAGKALLYADCNAVAPATVTAIGALFAGGPADFLDVGIVGPAPKPAAAPTRFYVAGAERRRLLALTIPEIALHDMGPEIGRASAIKMCYAGMNKGTDALYTTILLAAERLGVGAELMREFEASQPQVAARMHRRIPFLAATAARYTGEMREIGDSFAAAGVTPDFHRGAEWLYARLAESALADESRATLPAERSLHDALAAFLLTLPDA